MSQYKDSTDLKELMLGRPTEYASQYDASLLQPVPRALNRHELGIVDSQPFYGYDVWHAYELSWLNSKGKPVVALAKCIFTASSQNIVESKSFKLYLNSLNQTRFASQEDVRDTLIRDLSAIAGSQVDVELFSPEDRQAFQTSDLKGDCIDEIDIKCDEYVLTPELLTLDDSHEIVDETLYSHLLKSNCLITNQPDWATIIISYKGFKLDREALLRYLVSFRMHNEFHEQCVERIFMDIQRLCSPQELIVYALYTRRGGLDISPFRSSKEMTMPILRINRQ